MADRLGVKAVAALPVLGYDQVRDRLRTGDLVFCSGTYLFSKSIQWFTKSVWSHVAIIYRDDNLRRILVLESETAIWWLGYDLRLPFCQAANSSGRRPKRMALPG